MSANLGRRLYAHLWASANPFLGRIRPNHACSPEASSRKVFDSFFAGSRLSTPTAKTTHLTRRFASGGIFILGVSPSSTVEGSAACMLPAKKIVAQQVWKRAFHASNSRSSKGASSDESQIAKDNRASQTTQQTDKDASPSHQSPKSQDSRHPTPGNRHLMDRLPHMPHLHRPTKEELLAAATGFWSRLKVRFKWFSIRSVRPFNLDEITALFSWVLLGHVVWVVVGTTTFFSLLILAINTVFAQGTSKLPLSHHAC